MGMTDTIEVEADDDDFGMGDDQVAQVRQRHTVVPGSFRTLTDSAENEEDSEDAHDDDFGIGEDQVTHIMSKTANLNKFAARSPKRKMSFGSDEHEGHDDDFGVSSHQIATVIERNSVQRTEEESSALSANAELSVAKLGARLQVLMGAAAGLTHTHVSSSEGSPGAIGTCEDAVAALEKMIPQITRRFEKADALWEAADPEDAPVARPSGLDTSHLSVLGDPGEENAKTCHVCNANVGKRYLNPRQHCKACGRTVCGKCSPSMVKLSGGTSIVRVCNKCVSGVFTESRGFKTAD